MATNSPGSGRRTPLLALALDRDSSLTLQQQLCDQLRQVILTGRLAPGARLASSRALAAELGCSRNTVVTAFDQLLSEGYLEGHAGSGTFVCRVLPEELLGAMPVSVEAPLPPGSNKPPRLATRGRSIAGSHWHDRRHGDGRAFVPGMPDTAEFPFDIWGRLHARVWRRPAASLLRLGHPAGYQPLREAIADYVNTYRGLHCRWQQVIVTTGAQAAINLVTQMLLEPGDPVWIEEPGYVGLRGPLVAAGAELVPVPLDDEGMSVSRGRNLAPQARAVVVTPSHHYPLGTTLSLARRLELLEWARQADAWILEDDYDSEYRYAGRPLASLQGLAADRGEAGRVLYVGTFSKVLFPSIRLGYLVAPEPLVAPLTSGQAALGALPSALVQPVLAAFIEEGYFATHVRRMRRLYALRQAALVAAADKHLGDILTVAPDHAGLHLMAWLKPEVAKRLGDKAAARVAGEAGISVTPLADYFFGKPARQGLLLGYAAVPEDEINRQAARLGEALRRRLP
ncbi:PLP-dependent aminotransferase family protein [Pelagibius litoralis]|uniref:PLP-dependent aminotransferase family protein n=1 Tax=Pelagibius litoralis TaxID=374515 RepID=A0A967KCT1_9PROT|nr:PLP-dependent aminotransferase family protein [Pelagibius litoralis]NIA71039.1 PLP-dependent aminotransferase family protein [Pelagibius litoralis]